MSGKLIKKSDESVLAEASTTFTAAEGGSGTVELVFEFDASALAGQSAVAFEKCLDGDEVVATHEDLNDKDQTVEIVEPEKVRTTVTKDWTDENGNEISWPSGVSAEITVNYGEESQKVTLTAKKQAATVEFKKVEGATFSVEELKVEGYETAQITPNEDGSFTVVNKKEPKPEEPDQIRVTKQWSNLDGSNTWPSGKTIDVAVSYNGELVKNITLSEDHQYEDVTVEKKIPDAEFTVTETTEIEGYTSEVESGNGVIIITNTEEQPEPTYVNTKVKKVWKDVDGNDLPWPENAKVTVRVTYGDDFQDITLENGEAVTTKDFKEVEGASFNVQELEIHEGFTAGYGEENGTHVVTNTEIPEEPEKVSTEVFKLWVNADGSNTWPEGKTAEIRVKYNGKVVETLVLTADEQSKRTKEYEAVEGAVFEIEEISIEGYTTEIVGNDLAGFMVTNTENPVEEEYDRAGELATTVEVGGSRGSDTTAALVKAEDAGKTVDVVDTIVYKDLAKSTDYEVTGTLNEIGSDGSVKAIANSTETLTTDADGAGSWTMVFNGVKLEAGKKYVVFESAVNTEDTTEVVDHKNPDDTAQTVVVEEELPTEVKFSKTDLDGKELPGAEMVLTDAEGSVIDEWTSTTEEHIMNLVDGEYILTEKAAPEGYYCVTTEMHFEVKDGEATLKTAVVDNNGEIEVLAGTHIFLKDAPKVQSVYEEKTDEGDGGSEEVVEKTEKVTEKTEKAAEKTEVKEAHSTRVSTGDDSTLYIWAVMLMISLAAIVVTIIRRRRTN